MGGFVVKARRPEAARFVLSSARVTCRVLQLSTADGRSPKDESAEIMVFEEKMIMNGEPEDVSSLHRLKTTPTCLQRLIISAGGLTHNAAN